MINKHSILQEIAIVLQKNSGILNLRQRVLGICELKLKPLQQLVRRVLALLPPATKF